MSAQFLKAAASGDIDRAKDLIQHIHFQNKKGESALHVAISEGELSMVEFLCNQGANVNLQDKKGGNTTIMLTLAQQPRHFLAILEVLLKHQPDLTLKDTTGQTALHLAVQYGSTNAVELLLASKTNQDIRDSKGMTPLLVAAGKGGVHIVELLVSKGHNIHAVDCKGNSALHWAIASLDVTTYLVSKVDRFQDIMSMTMVGIGCESGDKPAREYPLACRGASFGWNVANRRRTIPPRFVSRDRRAEKRQGQDRRRPCW
ncbi:hypothetical protein, variant 3 [Aphanomyces invadans]|uniref:Uncharacterized protein n=1 Tax=Aphanomyces invadans TaxID=157072 RepID=A0A024U1B8_9STRA|nr:hypothetical protein, variant 2 [Aphanomyces invadans]XP_008871070.1 hypothetical protein, variant 3 [Aphanomyces invadans]ETW00044.1 hypothetical protein, variant 2 [Aphanomyces invadans]ETW00045.1 hypothetical protein, variant 3 [Aphanomyces invadans]|eukprot:XP_008871069.1 hypothetical protein, variant 2 [Aphanomyces invadans]